jgi:hypothetical protein
MGLLKNLQATNAEEDVGFVDIGLGPNTDKLAKDALVFMITCLEEHWKMPIAYFLLDGLSGMERAQLVQQAINQLYDSGILVVSLTCDGPETNISMLRHLGRYRLVFFYKYLITF